MFSLGITEGIRIISFLNNHFSNHCTKGTIDPHSLVSLMVYVKTLRKPIVLALVVLLVHLTRDWSDDLFMCISFKNDPFV
ncbi:hypothetical protein M6B38_300745 [Iris pallida]|uniref:Uncharacterized protein n=1 Tax=Iris pallida TaxID=29817 RepID=A0AAX6HR99_IRIPA|nr:hypothetical protein M6B38_335405 [Iris pallida]KAJ6843201.1 hypothetical protein M6B38_300745 [Iris pallida]